MGRVTICFPRSSASPQAPAVYCGQRKGTVIPQSDLLWAYLQSWLETVGLARPRLWFLKGDFCTLKRVTAFPRARPTPESGSAESLPHQTSYLPEPDVPLDLGGAWKGESYRDIYMCPGWTWLELPLPVLRHSRRDTLIAELHPVTPNLNVSPQKSSPLLIRMTGLAANLRCKGLI